MNINTFSSGTTRKQNDYYTFLPTLIDHTWKWSDPELNVLLEKASSELGSLNAFSDLIPNVDLYIEMHIKTEANKSNKIEGTRTCLLYTSDAADDLTRVTVGGCRVCTQQRC